MQKNLNRLQAVFGLAILGVLGSFTMSVVTAVREHHAKEEAKLQPVAVPAIAMPGNG